MNIKKLNEELNEFLEEQNVDFPSMCFKAYEVLDDLATYLEDNAVSPASGEMDADSKELHDKLADFAQELYSRSLA